MKGLDLQIEQIKQSKGISYIDAVLIFAEERELDFEDMVKELHSSTKEKIKYEFVQKRMVKDEKPEKNLEIFFN